jgi:ribosomal-protein-alanine N-acetyltransferase
MDLRTLTDDLAPLVGSWSATPAEAGMWRCDNGPVPAERILECAAEDGVHAYVMIDAGAAVAYGELWVDDDEREVELARLIVVPGRRSAGLGRALVAELTELAVGHYPDVFLRLRPDNAVAYRCYLAAGFVRVPEELEREWNAIQPVDYVWMRHTADRAGYPPDMNPNRMRADGTFAAEDDSLLRRSTDEGVEDLEVADDPDVDQRAVPETPAHDGAKRESRM